MSNTRKSLIKKGFIKIVDGSVQVVDFEKYLSLKTARDRVKGGLEIWSKEYPNDRIEQPIQHRELSDQPIELGHKDNIVITTNSENRSLVSSNVDISMNSELDNELSYDEYGFLISSLDEYCICDSGKLLKDCCYEVIKYSLREVGRNVTSVEKMKE